MDHPAPSWRLNPVRSKILIVQRSSQKNSRHRSKFCFFPEASSSPSFSPLQSWRCSWRLSLNYNIFSLVYVITSGEKNRLAYRILWLWLVLVLRFKRWHGKPHSLSRANILYHARTLLSLMQYFFNIPNFEKKYISLICITTWYSPPSNSTTVDLSQEWSAFIFNIFDSPCEHLQFPSSLASHPAPTKSPTSSTSMVASWLESITSYLPSFHLDTSST